MQDEAAQPAALRLQEQESLGPARGAQEDRLHALWRWLCRGGAAVWRALRPYGRAAWRHPPRGA
jgi:hypothetical protein